MIQSKISRCKSGIAMTEFALILPFFVLAVFGGMELAWEAVMRQKIQSIASTSADNAARIRGAIDETDILEVMTAARINGKSIDLENNARLIISSIQRNEDDDGNWIRWQRCIGNLESESQYGREGTGRRNSSLQNIGDHDIQPPPGNAIIVAEIEYRHEPLVTDAYFGRKTFRYETVHIVRDRTDLGIGNITEMSNGQRLTC
jgi:hypothetical protein